MSTADGETAPAESVDGRSRDGSVGLDDETGGTASTDEAAASRKRAKRAPPRLKRRKKDDATKKSGESVLAQGGAEVSDASGTLAPLEPWTGSREQITKVRLKRIVKENHGSDINQIAFNFRRRSLFAGPDMPSDDVLAGDSPNVVATVGGPQANIYDNEHDVDHLDIMSHFVIDGGDRLADSDRASMKKLGELRTCCWLRSPGDAVLAAGGTQGVVHILSVAFSAEMKQLEGHTATIVDLQAHPVYDHLLFSASSDGTVRLWNVTTGSCLAILEIPSPPSSASFDPTGNGIIVGTLNGSLLCCLIPDDLLASPVQDSSDDSPTEPHRLSHQGPISTEKKHRYPVDSIVCYGSGFLSKSIDGTVNQWEWGTKKVIRTYELEENRCRMDVSGDGRYFCCGTPRGTVQIFGLDEGDCIVELKQKRSTKPVRSCAFSWDGTNVLFAGENGFIWRFDYPRQ